MTRPTIHQKIALARAFGNGIQELPRAQFRQVLERNKTETNPAICHSHDFCDANMIMDAAFRDLLNRAPDLESDDDVELWGDAWSIAVAASFFVY